MKIWKKLRQLFKLKKSRWIKKKLVVTYWTLRENPAILDIESLSFRSKEELCSQYYIDKLELMEGASGK